MLFRDNPRYRAPETLTAALRETIAASALCRGAVKERSRRRSPQEKAIS
jgi:hypothetical protein